jgi:hypothetical protein
MMVGDAKVVGQEGSIEIHRQGWPCNLLYDTRYMAVSYFFAHWSCTSLISMSIAVPFLDIFGYPLISIYALIHLALIISAAFSPIPYLLKR